MSVIRRDFLPEHLKTEIESAGIGGVISVQARQSLTETAALIDFARQYDFIKAAVGWVPLTLPDVANDLERLANEPKLRGVRHVLQGEPDELYILRDDFNAGVRALKQFNLVYDILIFERHLPQTITFVDGHPSQVFVLDHIAKPRIKEAAFEPWNRNIRELAKRGNVFCKVSGMVTEAEWSNWSREHLKRYFDTVLEAFGPKRLMFGSDWPVCLVACGYKHWVKTVEYFAEQLSADEQQQLFGETAIKAYNLKTKSVR